MFSCRLIQWPMAGNRCHLRHSCHFPYHINHHVLSILANLKQIKTSLLLSVHPQAQLFIPLPCFISYVPKCHCLLSDFLASSLFPAHLNASAKFTFHKCKAISTFNVFIHYLFGCTRSSLRHVGSFSHIMRVLSHWTTRKPHFSCFNSPIVLADEDFQWVEVSTGDS